MRNAVCIKSFHSFAQRVSLIVGLFQQGDHILILLRRELRPAYCVQLLLKLCNLAFQRVGLVLKRGHSTLTAGHSLLEGRFQLLHAAVYSVDLSLQAGCLFRHTADVHLRCSCLLCRRAAAVGILQFFEGGLQFLNFCLKLCNLILCATCIDFRCQRLAEKLFQRLPQILDLCGQRLDSRKQFSASGLKSVRIYFGINDDRAVSLICHLTTFFLS